MIILDHLVRENIIKAVEPAQQLSSHVSIALLERLRLETHAAHQAMQYHPLMSQLMGDPVALDVYQRVLQAYYRLYLEIDPLIDLNISRHAIPYVYQPKAEWLKIDLDHYGLPSLAGRGGAREMERSLEWTLGSLYVVEGSTLGGAWFSMRLEGTLGVNKTSGGRFFHGYGEETMSRWETVKRVLTDQVVEHPPAIVSAAMEMFTRFRQALDQQQEVVV